MEKDETCLRYITKSVPDIGTLNVTEAISGGKVHVMMPITYLSPNYLAVRFIATAACLSRLGNRVSIVLSDSNIPAHRLVSQKGNSPYYLVSGRYAQQIIDQMSHLLGAFEANMQNIKILKASDFWIGITGNYSQFVSFYEVLGKLKIYAKDFENGKYEEAYHILEKPFTSFIFQNYSNLSKSDFGNPDYLLLNNKSPEMYRRASASMRAGQKDVQAIKSIIATQHLPVLASDDIYPSCYMSLSGINKIIENCSIRKDDIDSIKSHFILPIVELLKNMGKMPDNYRSTDIENSNALGYSMHEILGIISKLIDSVTITQEPDIRISSSLQANNIRKLLSSRRVITVLRYCTGDYTTVEIAKKTNLQVSNVSLYINKLRESGLVSSDRRPRLLVSNIVLPVNTLIS